MRFTIRDSAETGLAHSALSITLTDLTASYAFYSVFFKTPAEIPSPPRIIVELTTSMATAGENIYVSDLVLTEMWQDPLAPGSPWLALFPGVTDWIQEDIITVANTRTGGKLLQYMDAAFGLHELPYIFDEDSSPTYNDSTVA